MPEYPYERVGADLFELHGKTYLLSVDYYSKWPCVVEFRDTRSADIIQGLEKQFADSGIPQELVTDNGPQFSSKECRQFMDRLNIVHRTSSPYFPRSNGQSERFVQTVKKPR